MAIMRLPTRRNYSSCKSRSAFHSFIPRTYAARPYNLHNEPYKGPFKGLQGIIAHHGIMNPTKGLLRDYRVS